QPGSSGPLPLIVTVIGTLPVRQTSTEVGLEGRHHRPDLLRRTRAGRHRRRLDRPRPVPAQLGRQVRASHAPRQPLLGGRRRRRRAGPGAGWAAGRVSGGRGRRAESVAPIRRHGGGARLPVTLLPVTLRLVTLRLVTRLLVTWRHAVRQVHPEPGRRGAGG